MKQFNLLVFLFISVIATAQTTLVFEKHALKAGVDNPMTRCGFVEEGESGDNVSWDFSGLRSFEKFTGHLTESLNTDFGLANTELEEFGVHFFFDSKMEGIELYGYVLQDGERRVCYDTPYEKMRFPMSYNDSYTTDFSGEYFSNDESIGQIIGEGQIKADAWGTLSLPGNIRYENTLRVKSVRNYTITFENSTQVYSVVTYRWYNNFHRYPLLVLLETNVVNGQVSTKRTKAAYNLNAVKAATLELDNAALSNNLSVYPNPVVNDEFVIKLSSITSGFISISITDMAGREVVVPFAKGILSGENEILIKDEIGDLQEGLYMLNIQSDGKLITRELSIAR